MSEEKKIGKGDGRVLANDANLPEEQTADKPKFADSGLGSVDGYAETRIRIWQPYQVRTIRVGLKQRCGALSLDDLKPEHAKNLVFWLQTCLVDSRSRLVRPGAAGAKQLREDLTDEQILEAFKSACKLSGVFK